MGASYARLTRVLHAVEAAIPSAVSGDPNFAGLRLDPSQQRLWIAQFIADREPSLAERLLGDPAFRAVADAHGLRTGVERGPSRLLGACAAGDAGYTPQRNYAHFGTFGWIVAINGRAIGLGSYHVFCRAGDASRKGTPVYWRDRAGGAPPHRVGALYDFVPMAHAEPRLFDLALVAFDAATTFASLHAGWRRRARHGYPLRLGTVGAAAEDYYVVGAGMLEDRVEMRFSGVGTRKDAATGYYFRDQLFFEPVDARFHPVDGDSGAVVVGTRSNTVVGLLMMESSGFTVANPLHRMPYRQQSETVVLHGVELPAFLHA